MITTINATQVSVSVPLVASYEVTQYFGVSMRTLHAAIRRIQKANPSARHHFQDAAICCPGRGGGGVYFEIDRAGFALLSEYFVNSAEALKARMKVSVFDDIAVRWVTEDRNGTQSRWIDGR